MLQLRALDTLGGGNRDWLKARHHFDHQVGKRDGIAIAGEPGIAITAIDPAEIILVDTA